MSYASVWDLDHTTVETGVKIQGIKRNSALPPIKFHAKLENCKKSLFPALKKVQFYVLPFFAEPYYEDLVICAPPKSGKTCGVILGIFNAFFKSNNSHCQAIFLAPTNKIAEDLYSLCQKFAEFCDVIIHFKRKPDKCNKNSNEIFIGTTDKILDLFHSSAINLKKQSFLFVDEADCLGNSKKYFSDISQIHQKLAKSCRTIICSTSINSTINDFIKGLYNQISITIEDDIRSRFPIKKVCIMYSDRNFESKVEALEYLIGMKHFQGQMVIFCETKEAVSDLARCLNEKKFLCFVLSGDLSSKQKEQILTDFKENIIQVLITTRTFVSNIPLVNTTKLIHYDQVLDEKHLLNESIYKRREYILSKKDKCLEVCFIEEKWQNYLLAEDTLSSQSFFKGIEKIESEQVLTYFEKNVSMN